jgi:Phage integrase family
VVVIPAAIVPIVREHVGRMGKVDDDRLIFTSPKGTPLWHANFRQRVWLPALQAAGLPLIHFHDLRHTGNNLAADAGAGLRELMERMGHSTTRAALTYLHASDERQRVIAEALSKISNSELKRRGSARSDRHATGTKAAWRIVKIIGVCGDTWPDLVIHSGAPSATRTRDLLLRRQLLYPLSYRGRPDQRHGPSAGPSSLTGHR